MLGERIYQCRVQKNLSQLDLADALEVSRQSVSKWENNACAPELDKLVKMCELFEVSLDELVRGECEVVTGDTREQVTFTDDETVSTPACETETSSLRKMLGLALLGVACVTMGLAFLFSPRWLVGMAAASMFLVLGTICLLVKKHTALACIWGAFLMVYANLELLEPGILWLDLQAVVHPWLDKVLISMNQDFNLVSRVSFLLLLVLIGITVFVMSRKKKG